MMRRTSITSIMALMLLGTLHAGISYTPSMEIGSSLVLCSNLTLEKEPVDSRTSFAMDIEASPLSMTIDGRHTVSLAVKLSRLSDSLPYMNTLMLGSTRLGIFLDYEVRFSCFTVSVNLGAGYAIVNRQDMGYVYTDTSISASCLVDEYIAMVLDAGLVYRREYLETHVGVAMKLMLPSGITGGR